MAGRIESRGGYEDGSPVPANFGADVKQVDRNAEDMLRRQALINIAGQIGELAGRAAEDQSSMQQEAYVNLH